MKCCTASGEGEGETCVSFICLFMALELEWTFLPVKTSKQADCSKLNFPRNRNICGRT